MKNVKGFTLLELLIVVAIIGILAAITIPQFTEYRTKAYHSQYIESNTKESFKEWMIRVRNFSADQAEGYVVHLNEMNKGKDKDVDIKLKELMEQNAKSKKIRNNESTSTVSNSKEHGKTKERLSWDNKNTAKW